MKKAFIHVVIVFVCLSYWSCLNRSMDTAKYNLQQTAFDEFLANYREQSYQQRNGIQKEEFMNEFEQDLYHYLDSVKLFVNWEGKISEIKMEKSKSGKTALVRFEINYKPEKYREVKFKCLHIVDLDSLENDYIYNVVKNISNYSTVYFDGFIRTKNDGTVKYEIGYAGDNLNISYPEYEFFIVDVGTECRNDSLSVNLQNAINCCYEIVEPLKLTYLKLINEKEKNYRFKLLEPKYNNLKNSLMDDEKSYLERVNQALMLNFLYGD